MHPKCPELAQLRLYRDHSTTGVVVALTNWSTVACSPKQAFDKSLAAHVFHQLHVVAIAAAVDDGGDDAREEVVDNLNLEI